jgi:DNA phosphorothioation-dependent restriction protein DptG
MNDRYTITEEDVKRFKNNIKQIERWRGEAYENDDEVGSAIQDLKTMFSCMIYGDVTEVCPHCDQEQEINQIDAPCPNCGETLIACAMCTMEYADGCEGCPDGTAKNYDVKLDYFI